MAQIVKRGKAYDSVFDMIRGEFPEHAEHADRAEREYYETDHVSNDLFILRWRSGLTREEVAARMGVSPEYVANIEDGDDPVSPEDVTRVCAALGCEYEDFSRKKELV